MSPPDSRSNAGPDTPFKTRLMVVLATGFGAGLSPFAPGTFGSLFGLFLVIPFMVAHPLAPLFGAAVWFALGVWASNGAEAHYGAKDPGKIVIDEIAGIFVTFIAVSPTWPHLLAGFVLFRLFDIAKPFPCRWSERRFSGGMGVMADDMFAGAYALICLHLLIRFTGL